MSAPHADRDHSEQPVWPPKQRRDAEQGFTDAEVEQLVDAARCDEPGCGAHGSGTSRSVSARVVRASEAQVEAAIKAFLACESGLDCGHPDILCVCVWQAVADAVVAAGPDADEVTRLRAEVERLEATLERASRDTIEQARQHRALQARAEAAEAEVERLRAGIDQARMEPAQAEDAETAAEAEWDRLAEVVARVEALADEYARRAKAADRKRRGSAQRYKAAELWLRAAMSGPSPATTPGTPHAPAGAPESTSGQSGEGEALGGAESGEQRCCGHVRCPGGSLCCCHGKEVAR